MRSPIGGILVIIGLTTVAVLVLVLLQSISLRDDLRQARDEVSTLQARVDTLETVAPGDLRRELDGLEAEMRDLLTATGADGGLGTDPGQPAGGSTTADEILDRLDEVLASVEALDRRVDQICEGVPVC